MTKLPIKELVGMKPGDTFVVYWAKDDSAHDVRLDHVVQTILTASDRFIMTVDSYEWNIGGCPDMGGNLIDTSRGYAYFYRTQDGI